MILSTRPDALVSEGIKSYRIADHLGSTRLTIDGSTLAETGLNYEPFGRASIAGIGPPGASIPRQNWIDRE